MTDSTFLIYRRNLPHWRLEGALYFVTWRLRHNQHELAGEERTQIADALRHFDRERYDLSAWVIMNDHVHVLVQPREGRPLQEIVHTWKSFTANRLQKESKREGAVWQEEYFDRIVRDDKEFVEKANYIRNNPSKRWPDLAEYPWVWVVGS